MFVLNTSSFWLSGRTSYAYLCDRISYIMLLPGNYPSKAIVPAFSSSNTVLSEFDSFATAVKSNFPTTIPLYHDEDYSKTSYIIPITSRRGRRRSPRDKRILLVRIESTICITWRVVLPKIWVIHLDTSLFFHL